MNKLTRNKAAEILGVHPQTISNYVRDGLLGGYKDEKGNFYVNGDDVERYAKKYKFIAVSEEMLDNKLAALKAEREKASNELAALRRKMSGGRSLGILAPDVTDMITALYKAAFVPSLKQREYDLLTSFLNGGKLPELSERFGLSQERIRQIIAKACRKFTEQAEEINHNVRYNTELEMQVSNLEHSLQQLQKHYDAYRVRHGNKPIGQDTLPPEVLQIEIKDCQFRVRIINSLCNKEVGVYTIGDLLTKFTSLGQIRQKVRNLGNKSLYEIEDFLDAFGLFFKEEDETTEHFYIRLNEAIARNKNEYETDI